jgi:N-glycosidase YbiA
MSQEQVDATYKVTDTAIHGFFMEHRCLSNFHELPLTVDGITYPSSEHAYMAQKTLDRDTQLEVSMIVGSGRVKKFGQTIPLRPDWEYYRVAAMLQVLFRKFEDHNLAMALLETGDKYLEETNWRKDEFWGVCEGKGLNMLGKCLMIVREDLKKLWGK